MDVLVGRETKIFGELAAALLDRPLPSVERTVARARGALSGSTFPVRLFFRAALFLFEWGTLFLRTGSGRFEHFTRLPSRHKRRYLRLWMGHRRPAVRQIFLFLKLLALAAVYDDRAEAARVGYLPRWLC